MDLPVVRKSRIPRNVQGPTGNVGVASGSVNPPGTNEAEGQGRLVRGSAEPWKRLLDEIGHAARTRAPVSAEKGKGKCVEQPLYVSDDEEGSKEYVWLDEEDSQGVSAPDESGRSRTVAPSDEEDDETKIQKLSLAFKQEKAVYCKWRDGTYHPAKVLEIKEQPAGCFKFYIHYTQFDRRNDDWVNLEQLRTESSGPVVDNTRSGIMTRRQKRQMGIMEDDNELDLDETLREHEAETKVKKIKKIRLGNYEIETWYYTPLPPEYDDCEELYFCEYCLTFLKRERQLKRHTKKECNQIYPNGKNIYTSGQLTVFEVDGIKQRVYAENLCYLAKMFLDHKALSPVAGFLFYILCERDTWGFHIRGYFSKEKSSEVENILACILTLPPYQKKGYGNFLIAF